MDVYKKKPTHKLSKRHIKDNDTVSHVLQNIKITWLIRSCHLTGIQNVI